MNNPTTGSYVEKLLSEGFHKPRGGVDVGDHPPITPVKSATEDMLGIDAWRLYQYVCQHFLGSVSPDCKYIRQALIFSPHPLYMFCLSFLNVAKLGLFPSYDLAAFSPCGCAQSICFLTFFLPNSKIFLVKKWVLIFVHTDPCSSLIFLTLCEIIVANKLETCSLHVVQWLKVQFLYTICWKMEKEPVPNLGSLLIVMKDNILKNVFFIMCHSRVLIYR